MARKFKGEKDPYAELDSEWKDGIASMSDEDIKQRVADIALNYEELMKAKKNDEDLKQKVAEATEAGRVYKEGAKGSRLRIQYARMILEARGKA